MWKNIFFDNNYNDFKNNEKVNMNEERRLFIDLLKYDSENKHLEVIIKLQTTKPKITRYITRNYVKKPIYGDYSVREKLIKKINKNINPILFVNEQIRKLQLPKEILVQIIEEIGIIPLWLKNERKIQLINNKIYENNKSIQSYEISKTKYKFLKIDYPENYSNFWLRLLYAIPTLFLSFFINYLTKSKASENKELNIKNRALNVKHKKDIDIANKLLNKKINFENKKINKKNELLSKEIEKLTKINNNQHIVKKDSGGWINLRDAVNFSNEHLNLKKGIYIINNISKNKYYVGQSKNLKKRIFKQHFKKGEVNNIIFAKDWYNNDNFKYKVFICETKDELDNMEKKYIDIYNSFENGYNSTHGNI